MDDKIVNISFNIWANSEDEAKELKQSICDFIDWFGERGIKVTASKTLMALGKWHNNPLVRNSIINYYKN